jgi:AcrR family transcriptional regulator
MNTKQLIINSSLKFILSPKGELNSINEVIKGMGYTKGAFFHYFKSKEDFYSQLFQSIFKSALLETEKILKRSRRDIATGLKDFGEHLAPESRSDISKLFYAYKICHNCAGTSYLISTLRNFEEELQSVFEQYFRYHQGRYQSASPTTLTSVLCLLVKGIFSDNTDNWRKNYSEAISFIAEAASKQ